MAEPKTINDGWRRLILKGVNPTGREIGHGAYGRVFEISYEGTLCAAKELHKQLLDSAQDDLQGLKESFLDECQIWSTLRHPNVVQFLGVYYPAMNQQELPVIVMEKMQYSLKCFVEKYASSNIPLSVKLSILNEVCLGLRYLHTRSPPIVHRDLTPNNILVSRFLEAKITDLGVAKVMQTTDSVRTMTKGPGALPFMPPECLAKKPKYGLPMDIFSLGGVILFIATQQWPDPVSWIHFDDSGQKRFLSELERRQQYLDEMTGSTKELIPLVRSCLDDNPGNRLPIAEVTEKIKALKEPSSKKRNYDGTDSVLWLAEVLRKQQPSQRSQTQQQITPMGPLPTIGKICKQAPPLAEALRSKRYKIKWTKLADLPVPLSGTYAVADDMKIYVTGCLSTNEDSYHEVYVYDCASDQWDKLPQSGHYYGVPHVVGGKLVLIGGRLSASKKKTNKVSTFDTLTRSWINYYPDMLSVRSRPGVVSYLEYIMVAGGGGEDEEKLCLNTIEVLNYIENTQWKEVSLRLPSPMWRITPTIVSDQLYIVNYNFRQPVQKAYKVPVASILPSHEEIVISDTTWTELAVPITFAAAVLTDSPMLLVFGGSNKENISTTDALMYDATMEMWKNIDPFSNLSEARSFAAITTVTKNAIIIVGGYRFHENSELSKCMTTVELGQAKLIS